MRSVLTLVSLTSIAALAVHCGGSSLSIAPAGTCNVDGDCKSVDELCRDHKCVPWTNKKDTSDPDAAVSSTTDAGNGPDTSIPDDPFASCNVVDVGIRHEPLILEIVLDGSGSMQSDNKWTAAADGVGAFFDDVFAHPEPSLAVGLSIFEDTNDPTHGTGPYPSAVDVRPAPMDQSQHTKLKARVLGTTPNGGTPTYLALSGAYTMMNNFVIPPGAPLTGARKTVVLISDGNPNGGAGEQAQCTAAATGALHLGAPGGPITTFAIGVGWFPGGGADYDPKFMSELAIAGGTRSKPQCSPTATIAADLCHVQITPNTVSSAQMVQLFASAVQRARTTATGCELNLDPSSEFDASRARVTMTDATGKPKKIVQGDPDGWDFDDPSAPTKIIFSGLACDDLSTGAPPHVEACEP